MAKKIKPININMRKQAVFDRKEDIRKRGLSSMEEARKMVEEADPGLVKTLERNGKYYKK